MEREIDGNERAVERPDPFGRYELPGVFGEEDERNRPPGGPTWRALVLAVIAAMFLSVSATLLLGGSFGFTRVAASTGCGPGSVCCPPADSLSGGR